MSIMFDCHMIIKVVRKFETITVEFKLLSVTIALNGDKRSTEKLVCINCCNIINKTYINRYM